MDFYRARNRVECWTFFFLLLSFENVRTFNQSGLTPISVGWQTLRCRLEGSGSECGSGSGTFATTHLLQTWFWRRFMNRALSVSDVGCLCVWTFYWTKKKLLFSLLINWVIDFIKPHFDRWIMNDDVLRKCHQFDWYSLLASVGRSVSVRSRYDV